MIAAALCATVLRNTFVEDVLRRCTLSPWDAVVLFQVMMDQIPTISSVLLVGTQRRAPPSVIQIRPIVTATTRKKGIMLTTGRTASVVCHTSN